MMSLFDIPAVLRERFSDDELEFWWPSCGAELLPNDDELD